MSIKVKSGQTVLFIGDSITDCGWRDSFAPLGWGYVKYFNDFITIREPAKKVNIINKGTNGHRIADLRDRWNDDVLRHKPDWLSIKVGINDLQSRLWNWPPLISPEMFEQAYDEVLSQTKAKLPRTQILLIDPFYLSKATLQTSSRKTALDLLPGYIRVVHKMVRKYKTRHIKTHDLFQNLLKYHEGDTFCGEPIHPNHTGHLAIADAVYAALSK